MQTGFLKRHALALVIGGVLVTGAAVAGIDGLRGPHADVTEVVPIVVREDIRAEVIGVLPVMSAREKVVGYDVSYRTDDGASGTLRMDGKPGHTVVIGQADRTVAYHVSYEYGDRGRTVRLDRDPGPRLPIVDGTVVLPGNQDLMADSGGSR